MTHEKIHEGRYGESPANYDIVRHDEIIGVTLLYPGLNGVGATAVEIDQESVRASDGIRVEYDYDRDGWSIKQPRPYLIPYRDGGHQHMADWIETAFVQSWALDIPEDEREVRQAGATKP